MRRAKRAEKRGVWKPMLPHSDSGWAFSLGDVRQEIEEALFDAAHGGGGVVDQGEAPGYRESLGDGEDARFQFEPDRGPRDDRKPHPGLDGFFYAARAAYLGLYVERNVAHFFEGVGDDLACSGAFFAGDERLAGEVFDAYAPLCPRMVRADDHEFVVEERSAFEGGDGSLRPR